MIRRFPWCHLAAIYFSGNISAIYFVGRVQMNWYMWHQRLSCKFCPLHSCTKWTFEHKSRKLNKHIRWPADQIWWWWWKQCHINCCLLMGLHSLHLSTCNRACESFFFFFSLLGNKILCGFNLTKVQIEFHQEKENKFIPSFFLFPLVTQIEPYHHGLAGVNSYLTNSYSLFVLLHRRAYSSWFFSVGDPAVTAHSHFSFHSDRNEEETWSSKTTSQNINQNKYLGAQIWFGLVWFRLSSLLISFFQCFRLYLIWNQRVLSLRAWNSKLGLTTSFKVQTLFYPLCHTSETTLVLNDKNVYMHDKNNKRYVNSIKKTYIYIYILTVFFQ